MDTRTLRVIVSGLAICVCAFPGILYGEPVNLATLPGAAYQYVDGDGNPIPGQYGDDKQLLTDGRKRTAPVVARDALRVRFALGVPASPQEGVVVLQTRGSLGADEIRVYAGNAPDQMALTTKMTLNRARQEGNWQKIRIPLDDVRARYLQVSLLRASGGKIAVGEVEFPGTAAAVSDTAPSAAASLVSAAEIVRRETLKEARAAGNPLAMLNASLKGVEVIDGTMTEAQVRKTIAGGKAGDLFFLEPRNTWTLTDTLHIPEGVSLVGTYNGGARGWQPTFVKGFDGPLATVTRFVTLYGLFFEGNKGAYAGDGIVAVGGRPQKGKITDSGIRELRMIRVAVYRNRGHGYVMKSGHYFSEFKFCTFDRNDGYAVVYDRIRSHNTDNLWTKCHFAQNRKGAFAFYSVENSSIWQHCEFFHNGGPAFTHFLIHKKLGHGKKGIGPRPSFGAGALTIRNCIMRDHAGPVWLQRGGRAESIVFEDCRLKHNGFPHRSGPLKGTPDAGKSMQELFGLAGPVSGLMHVEGGHLSAELRGGFAWDNGEYIFSAGPQSVGGNRILVSSSSENGFTGGIHAPRGFATILDLSMLPESAPITVQGGIGLDPRTGRSVALHQARRPQEDVND